MSRKERAIKFRNKIDTLNKSVLISMGASLDYTIDEVSNIANGVVPKSETGKEWSGGQWYDIDIECLYNGETYIVIQSHMSLSHYTPDLVPALYTIKKPSEGSEWKEGVIYVMGDIVTYEGVEYVCIMDHTSQAGWNPSVVPALWKPLS